MIMIYSVCALFIDEVYFHDTTNSNGIIIDRVPPRKKVSAQRKCFYCDRLGKCFNLGPITATSSWGKVVNNLAQTGLQLTCSSIKPIYRPVLVHLWAQLKSKHVGDSHV